MRNLKAIITERFFSGNYSMKQERKTPIILTEEQERFFIETWENNLSTSALVIIREKLGLGYDAIHSYAKKLRETGKIRNKKQQRFSDNEITLFKQDYENGLSIKAIAEKHNKGAKAVLKYLKSIYGGKLPQIKSTLDGESWKDIEHCSNHQVSNKGRIYVKSKNQIIYGHIAHGYRYVNILDDDGNKHVYAVHRLVAQAFIPNPDNKLQVDHKDSNPQNNDADNLRWVNQEDQLKNVETIKKKKEGIERMQRHWKVKPLLKKILEIEPDKMVLIKMIIDFKD